MIVRFNHWLGVSGRFNAQHKADDKEGSNIQNRNLTVESYSQTAVYGVQITTKVSDYMTLESKAKIK